jgi:preprotein translocase subunit YajC
VSILIALFPLLFWLSIVGAIIYFIVRKVKRSRRALEERIEVLERNQAVVKDKNEF